MQLIITEITEMHNNMRCVGAWDPQQQRVVRPLPGGSHWSEQLIESHGLIPGSRINVTVNGQHQSEFPHKTEDTLIDVASIENLNDDYSNWLSNEAPHSENSIGAIFGDNLQLGNEFQGYHKCYIHAGANCRSLYGLRVDVENIEFFESRYLDKPPQLRAHVTDLDRGYDLPVSSLGARGVWRSNGVGALKESLPDNGEVHLRIGLARPWEAYPNRCFMQLNGVLY